MLHDTTGLGFANGLKWSNEIWCGCLLVCKMQCTLLTFSILESWNVAFGLVVHNKHLHQSKWSVPNLLEYACIRVFLAHLELTVNQIYVCYKPKCQPYSGFLTYKLGHNYDSLGTTATFLFTFVRQWKKSQICHFCIQNLLLMSWCQIPQDNFSSPASTGQSFFGGTRRNFGRGFLMLWLIGVDTVGEGIQLQLQGRVSTQQLS